MTTTDARKRATEHEAYNPQPGKLGLVYLAGPMRGIPEFNFPAFFAAEARLVADGWGVFNPAAMDTSTGFVPTALSGDEDLSGLGFSLRNALGNDLEFITRRADAVAVLPGWEDSKGARAEVATAHALGLPVFYALEGRSHVVTEAAAPKNPSGETRVTSSTGGQKGQKPEQYQSIPVGPMRELAEHYAKGAIKYDDHNFRKGYPWSSSFSALSRHLWAFWGGEDIDAETGSKHVIAVAWHALALASFMDEHREFDDRFTPTDAVIVTILDALEVTGK